MARARPSPAPIRPSALAARKDLYALLSWNGALNDPAAYPRFCPGQQLSMAIVKAILGSIDELNGGGIGSTELLDLP